MKQKIKNIYIILTPFHFKVMKHLFKTDMQLDSSLIIYSKNIFDEINSKHTLLHPNIEFSIDSILKNPFKEFLITRNKLKTITKFIEKLENNYLFNSKIIITIGTEKDNFTQLLLNKMCKTNNVKLIAVEEGTGYYVNEKIKTKFLKPLYYLFSEILMGHKINYVTRFGTDKRISVVYCRYPEMLPSKRTNVEYIKFKLKTEQLITDHTERKNILFFSFPEQDLGKSLIFKQEIYLSLKDKYLKKGQIMFIKPHPRENINELEDILKNIPQIKMLDHKILGEDINFNKYLKIVNFSSSIVMYLLESKYPRKDIITIGLSKKPILSFYSQTTYIWTKKLLRHRGVWKKTYL